MQQHTSLVSSRGLLKSCNNKNASPISSSSVLDQQLLNDFVHNGVIYVCTDAIENFAANYLSRISAPFVFVTGDSDRSITDELLVGNPGLRNILQSPYLIRWYAQNLAITVDEINIFPMPIGLDYHTMVDNPGLWGLSAISPIAQERQLIRVLGRAPEFIRRYPIAYCNWHFELQRGDRLECFHSADRNACLYEPTRVPRSATWARQSECMYVISPEGYGIDCHRTWEAIALGCVPIIKRNAISSLFELLPVLLVDDWREVTPEFLERNALELENKLFNYSSMFLQFWVDRFRQISSDIENPMTMRAYVKYMTFETN